MENNEQYSELVHKPSLLRKPGAPARIPFCIRTLGSTKAQKAHVSRGTYFEDVMLTWFPKGKGLFHRKSGRIALSAGMMGLILPEEGDSLIQADPKDPYTHYYCRFAGAEALRMAYEIRQKYPDPFFIHPRGLEVARLLESMVAQGISREAGEEAVFMKTEESQLALILSLLCESPISVDRKTRGLKSADLSEYILQHVSELVCLEDAAEHFRVSKSYFCRECRRLLGVTYQKAMEREKMVWASSLLRDGILDLTVAETAYRVGYNDPLYFSKVFKRIHGFPPSRLKGKASPR